jgi:hypothetical protein
MSSSLTWIDHDSAARERAIRILSFMQQKESRDELGLGAIRDSFADALFPGTSTIQTRMRYMLFIPWFYTALEKKRVTHPAFAARARNIELALTEPLLSGSDQAGIFGRVAGQGLKRLPSSVYWNGLGVWGIRRIDLSRDEYHRHINEIYRRRDIVRQRTEKDDLPELATQTWHPRLPDPPEGFPDSIKNLGIELTTEDASFLLDCLVKSNPESLLVFLALKSKPVECEFPWQHADRERFSSSHRELLDYGEMFSTLMHGAGYLYNLMLAEVAQRKSLMEEHRANLESWKEQLLSCPNINLPLEKIWDLTAGRGHTITPRTKEFITAWHRRVMATRGGVVADEECRTLIRNREIKLKGSRSRFTNVGARDNWGGYAGVGQMAYRWPNVKVLLADLYAGLYGGGNAQS